MSRKRIKRAARLLSFAAIEPRPLKWLWPGILPFGKFCVLVGEPGMGKSSVMIDIAARITRGDGFPGHPGSRPPGSVILVTMEDDPHDTIAPRLLKAGAVVSKVHLLKGVEVWADDDNGVDTDDMRVVPFTLSHLTELREAIARMPDVQMVIIDPISGYLGGADSHKNADVREKLEPLAELAADLGLVVVGVTHFRKGEARSAVEGLIGSIGFSAVARAVWGLFPDHDDEDRRLLVPIKANLSKMDRGYSFRFDEGSEWIIWDEGRISVSANELVAGPARSPGRPRDRLDRAIAWTIEALKSGPMASAEFFALGKAAGHSEKTLRRAGERIGVRSDKGEGKNAAWVLSLPFTATGE